MKKGIRKIAFAFALAIFAVMLFSTLFIAAEADHDCIGDCCPLCTQIDAFRITLKSLGYGAAAIALVIALTYAFSILFPQFHKYSAHITLVSLKVKLSD